MGLERAIEYFIAHLISYYSKITLFVHINDIKCCIIETQKNRWNTNVFKLLKIFYSDMESINVRILSCWKMDVEKDYYNNQALQKFVDILDSNYLTKIITFRYLLLCMKSPRALSLFKQLFVFV